MKKCDVSIVVPVYNGEKYLEENIKSLLVQTYKDFELIYVNDGSTDSTEKIILDYQKRDIRIKIINQENKGAAVARNRGIEQAVGEYLLILDADDFFCENMIEFAIRKARQCNADVVIYDGYRYDEISKEITNLPGALNKSVLPDKEIFYAKDIPEDIFQITGYWVWNKLYRLDFIRNNSIMFQSIPLIDDAYFNVIALACAERITYIIDRLIYYRVNNVTSKSFSLMKRSQYLYEAHKHIIDELKKRNLYRDYYISIYRGFINHYDYMMNKIEDVDLFIQSYESIKGYLKNANIFEIINQEEALVQYREKYNLIRDNSAIQYLFDFYKDKIQYIPRFIFPKERVKQKDKIVLYGAGTVGRYFYAQNFMHNYCQIITWVDRDFEALKNELNVHAPNSIYSIEYDYILIAIETKWVADGIKKHLIEQGVDESKIIWNKPTINI